ncbi:hypothetical protein FBU31_007255, partial [Coemansia sp. 'formosensis']
MAWIFHDPRLGCTCFWCPPESRPAPAATPTDIVAWSWLSEAASAHNEPTLRQSQQVSGNTHNADDAVLRQLAGRIERLSPGNAAPRQMDAYLCPQPKYIMRTLDGDIPAYCIVVETYEQAQARVRRLHSDFGLDDDLSSLTAGSRSGVNDMRTQGGERTAPYRQSQPSTQGLPMV